MKAMKSGLYTIVSLGVVLLLALLTACNSGLVGNVSETGGISGDGGGSAVKDKESVNDYQVSTDTIAGKEENNTEEPYVAEQSTESAGTDISDDYYLTMDNHFGFNPAFLDYKTAAEAGGQWGRPHFELFSWAMIEPEPGRFYFMETDHLVQKAQQNGFHLLANLQPRSLWDESGCYDIDYRPEPGMPVPFTEAHKPCDMEAYKRFVTALVERYDGDGLDDMPGLTGPIKHWEIMNEPEFPMYFLGTPAEYLEIVKSSTEAIKAADPDALVVQGGMAGMDHEMTDFWQQVFDLGVADYFDILNMHSIGHGEHLNIPAFREFLSSNGVTGKPIWVTEVQYQQARQTEDYSLAQFAAILARSYVFAFANDVDKFFYVNLVTPFDPVKEDKEPLPGDAIGGPPFDERSALIDDNGNKTLMFYTHQTIARKLGTFGIDDKIEVLKQVVGEWHIEQGHYRFTIDGLTLYALWGTGPIPAEIQGLVTVTEISGDSRIVDADEIILNDVPIFVEPLQ